MNSYVINGDKIEIKKFENILWKKETNTEKLPQELKKIIGITENVSQSDRWYFHENDEYILYAFMSNIGADPHPLIDIAYACTWYNSNFGGVYLVGRDKKNSEFFAPIKI